MIDGALKLNKPHYIVETSYVARSISRPLHCSTGVRLCFPKIFLVDQVERSPYQELLQKNEQLHLH